MCVFCVRDVLVNERRRRGEKREERLASLQWSQCQINESILKKHPLHEKGVVKEGPVLLAMSDSHWSESWLAIRPHVLDFYDPSSRKRKEIKQKTQWIDQYKNEGCVCVFVCLLRSYFSSSSSLVVFFHIPVSSPFLSK